MSDEDKQSKEKIKKLGSAEDVLNMTAPEMMKLYRRHLNPVLANIVRFMGTHQNFVEARGSHLKDDQGRDYLDFLSGFGALNLGHEPQALLDILRKVEGRPNILQSALNPFAAKLAEYLAELTPEPLRRSFFCNSGAEAAEAALKLARKTTGRTVLLSTEGAYHGKTYGALSVSGKNKYKDPFKPLLPDTEQIPFNDVKALEARLSKGDVAGFIVEPIQGENGVIVPSNGYLKNVESLCRKNGTLLLLDEIQTGMGRTGKLFCFEHENVCPDILILSKSLSGGMVPIGAIVTRDDLWKTAYGKLENGLLHSTTFGGNTRACACGVAAIQTTLEQDLPGKAQVAGKQLMNGLKGLQQKYSILEEVRGKGLMIGLSLARVKGNNSLTEGAVTLWVARQLVKRHRILTAFTLNNLDVLRIAPPLNVTDAEINYFVESLEQVLNSLEILGTFNLTKKCVNG